MDQAAVIARVKASYDRTRPPVPSLRPAPSAPRVRREPRSASVSVPVNEERAEELARQATVIKRRRGIPYKDLERAKKIGQERFPEAARINALLYMNAPYLEVWNEDGGALIYFVDLDEGKVIERSKDPVTKSRRRRRRKLP